MAGALKFDLHSKLDDAVGGDAIKGAGGLSIA
jgi:hypothetical protein